MTNMPGQAWTTEFPAGLRIEAEPAGHAGAGASRLMAGDRPRGSAPSVSSYNQMLWMSIPDMEAAYPPE